MKSWIRVIIHYIFKDVSKVNNKVDNLSTKFDHVIILIWQMHHSHKVSITGREASYPLNLAQLLHPGTINFKLDLPEFNNTSQKENINWVNKIKHHFKVYPPNSTKEWINLAALQLKGSQYYWSLPWEREETLFHCHMKVIPYRLFQLVWGYR